MSTVVKDTVSRENNGVLSYDVLLYAKQWTSNWFYIFSILYQTGSMFF